MSQKRRDFYESKDEISSFHLYGKQKDYGII